MFTLFMQIVSTFFAYSLAVAFVMINSITFGASPY